MSLPERSVRRPITVGMITVALAVFGILALERLPVELLPDLSYPTLTIQTAYPDAAPASVEQFVTRPVEEAVGVVPGVRAVRSTSRAGLSEVVLEFDGDEPMDVLALEVREKLGLVQLPREADVPRVLRYDPSLDPILRIALSGDRPLDDLRRLAERWIEPRLEAVDGVAAAKVRGGLVPEIEIEADEDRLAALGLALEDLARSLASDNVNLPGGTLKDWGSVYWVRTFHEFDDLDSIRRTIVRESPAGRVRIEDVASVRRSHRDREEIVRAGGREVVEIAIHREGSANTVEVAQAVRRQIASLSRELPEGLELVVLADLSRYISDAIRQVWSAAALGGILAVLVLYFFLRDLRATGIIALSIPVSVVATFLPMQKAGVSLNVMSLGGLALGIGMLVDNSIVVLEAIDRRRREGLPRPEAAIAGAGEVASAVTASTLTTVSVFFPIVFVQGIAGQLFYDLAMTVCVSLLASLLVSLTLVPSLAAIEPRGSGPARRPERRLPWTVRLGGYELLPIGDGRSWTSRLATIAAFPVRAVLLVAAAFSEAAGGAVLRAFEFLTVPFARGFEALARAYPDVLGRALARRGWILLGAVALFASSLLMVPLLGTSLVPDLSQGEFSFRLSLPAGTPLEGTARVVQEIESALLSDGRFEQIFSVVGSVPSSGSGRSTAGENLAHMSFVLRAGSRASEEERAIERVRAVLSQFGGLDAELERPAVLALRPPVVVHVFAEELDVLDRAASLVASALGTVRGLADIATSIEPGSPEIRVEVDRERAAALGVSAEAVGRALRSQIRGEIVGHFREAEERVPIRLRASERARDRASAVETLRLRLPNGSVVPVAALARVETARGPAAIQRAKGGRVAEVTARASVVDLGRVLEDVRETLSSLRLPPGATAEMAGQDQELAVSFASLRLALALAVFLVYTVMAIQFESLLRPFVILLAVPLGVVGAVAGLAVTGTSVSVITLIGLVVLAGIVVNNAIVLVDAVNRRRRGGEGVVEALLGAAETRLRPILMTTATTVLGLLPMAVGLGAGDELRSPLAVTLIGGLAGATLLTLVVIPCLYLLLTGARPLSADDRTPRRASVPAAGGVSDS